MNKINCYHFQNCPGNSRPTSGHVGPDGFRVPDHSPAVPDPGYDPRSAAGGHGHAVCHDPPDETEDPHLHPDDQQDHHEA